MKITECFDVSDEASFDGRVAAEAVKMKWQTECDIPRASITMSGASNGMVASLPVREGKE